jgi:hypothetical protein
MATPDRREHQRAPLAAPVMVEAFSAWHRARSKDVSVGGVLVACGEPLPVGKSVEIYFELPSGVAIETQAIVVRAHNDAVAFRFERLDPETELALRAHCHTSALKLGA